MTSSSDLTRDIIAIAIAIHRRPHLKSGKLINIENIDRIRSIGHMRLTRWLGVGVVAATLLLGMTSTAAAQYGPRRYQAAPGPGYYPYGGRYGLVVGLGLGFGGLTADGCGDLCGGALSLSAHIGGMLNPRAALLFDVWTSIHPIPNSDGDTTNTLYVAALQYWVAPIVWIEGGLGLGNTQISSNSQGTLSDATQLALMGAVGVEVVQIGGFALDLQGRLGHTFYSQADGGPITSYAFLVGFNWY